MHISDGILPMYVVIAGWTVALPALTLSIRHLNAEKTSVYGVIAATFFAGSTIHIPVGPFSVHLVLNGIAGLLLGWESLTILTVVLLLQALFLGFGGITVLGINISVMAIPGAIMGILGRKWIKQASIKQRPWIGAFICAVTILFSAVLLYVTLSTTNTALVPLAKIVFLGHIPVAVAEGFIGYWLVYFFQKVKPILLGLTD